MVARIYSPARTAMQSGKRRTGRWLLRYEPAEPKMIEPLMGYTSTTDMNAEVKMCFPTKEDAIAFAEKNNIAYEVEEPHLSSRLNISYSNNFRFDRQKPWTH